MQDFCLPVCNAPHTFDTLHGAFSMGTKGAPTIRLLFLFSLFTYHTISVANLNRYQHWPYLSVSIAHNRAGTALWPHARSIHLCNQGKTLGLSHTLPLPSTQRWRFALFVLSHTLENTGSLARLALCNFDTSTLKTWDYQTILSICPCGKNFSLYPMKGTPALLAEGARIRRSLVTASMLTGKSKPILR